MRVSHLRSLLRRRASRLPPRSRLSPVLAGAVMCLAAAPSVVRADPIAAGHHARPRRIHGSVPHKVR